MSQISRNARKTLDLLRLRADTPGTKNRNHLNNAGAALMPSPVIEAVVGYLRREGEIGGYEAAAESNSLLEGTYDSLATFVNCGRDEIAIAENATIAWQRAFYSLSFRPGDRILTASAEFAANYIAFLQVAKRTGVSIEVIPNDASGVLDPDALAKMIDDRVRLIAVTWIPTNGGLINPAAAIGRIARKNGILYLLDACQAAGQIPIDVNALGCDILTATGRKFLRAPRGTGFMYMRKSLVDKIEPAMIDLYGAPWTGPDRYELRPDARRFETWEKNCSVRLGLRAAVDYALDIGLENIEERCNHLSSKLREGLRGIRAVSVHDLGRPLASIISFTVNDWDSSSVMAYLTGKGINVSVSPPSSTPVDAYTRQLPPVVRASPHYYNTEDEIDAFLEAIAGIAS
ncbi:MULTISPECIES: aminotransferase class V-fold PLP-dependent enzyme [Rhizobium]|uniref:Aminotransferase class V-fold PLP-dependent enzyme n=3 Tax=Rhizobium TaxID=379 RepID=A0AB35FPX9_9HYPH|nr:MULTISPECIES: aminotransferase class V-fold PLP-dependent enzyme [Rhizobium]MBY3068370.1 aminotransferase class V-fold PLP-dependent enzyme [Rhizobium laguerreae]MBY5436423.1 aminotransferase class V-fold PLP-dependent enzyme [Rhizobium leguminosarum]NEI32650.1 aminotransferase class V-fold PLP-dependent enzyme [Rhizobium leguminosarum]NEI39409.1 aminotransferase class V-fold PLP-dependent enzyme [Rhizobium leguminosarum]NKK10397.1 aminotransferase class V-fold PLP-dependent enzyme [Rhizobi